jgi:hypothetical protein
MKPIPTEKTQKDLLMQAIEEYKEAVDIALDSLIEKYHRLYSNTLLLAYVAMTGAIYLLLSLINYFY